MSESNGHAPEIVFAPGAALQDVLALAAATPAPPARPAPIYTDGKTVRPCLKWGGTVEVCNEGQGKANRCDHSKWGPLATFDGPCACALCHDWPAAR